MLAVIYKKIKVLNHYLHLINTTEVNYINHKNKLIFTGDVLLIRGCGRTDF